MNKIGKQFALLLIAGILGAVIGVSIVMSFNKNDKISSNDNPGKLTKFTVDQITLPTFDFSAIAERITPTVVHIKTTIDAGSRENPHSGNPFFDFFDPKMFQYPQSGSGSGVIISEDGYIVTNNHVIADADEIEVSLHDKRTFKADVIGRDPQTDLALVKIDAKDLPSLEYGNSDDLKVGEWVLALGNPFNLNSTVTAGIVSAKARSIGILGGGSSIESFIQTDAAVNPGNSGGALVNVEGKLIGINSAIASRSGQYEGYSFAVPSNIVTKVIDDIKKYGKVQRGLLGVNITEVTPEIAKENKLKSLIGVYVADVLSESAANEAGIKNGDIIIKIDDKEVNSVPELQQEVSMNRPGDVIAVTVLRNSSEKTFKAKLKDFKGNTEIVIDQSDELRRELGAEFTELTSTEKSKMGIENGVRVSSISAGKMRSAGISKNFVITKIDRKKVYKVADVFEFLSSAKEGVLIEGIEPDGSKGYYGFGMSD
ncbi:MAG: Do family serine endopeptidase [Bacteroidetes bacterium]|nr:Do family serine endopeptidase [Bacteroidota bacterium]